MWSSMQSEVLAVLPMVTGTVSLLGTIAVVFVICRSRTKLSNSYHRMIFGMSLCVILHSIALASSTLPVNADYNELTSSAVAAAATAGTNSSAPSALLAGDGSQNPTRDGDAAGIISDITVIEDGIVKGPSLYSSTNANMYMGMSMNMDIIPAAPPAASTPITTINNNSSNSAHDAGLYDFDGPTHLLSFAMGNTCTCNIQGYILTWSSTSIPCYFCGISIYFLLVITMGTSEDVIQKWLEPIVHFLSNAWGILIATLSFLLDGDFHSFGTQCRIPNGVLMQQMEFWSVFITIIIILVNMLIVYRTLLQQEKSSRTISIGCSGLAAPPPDHNHHSQNDDDHHHHHPLEISFDEERGARHDHCHSDNNHLHDNDENQQHHDDYQPVAVDHHRDTDIVPITDIVPKRSSSTDLSTEKCQLDSSSRSSHTPNTNANTNAPPSTNHLLHHSSLHEQPHNIHTTSSNTIFSTTNTSYRSNNSNHSKKSRSNNTKKARRSTATERRPSVLELYAIERSKKSTSQGSKDRQDGMIQALLYIAAFVTSYLPKFTCFGLQLYTTHVPFALRVIDAICYPIQGFLFFLIFIRPRMIKIKKRNASYGYFKIMRIAVMSKGDSAPLSLRRNSITRRRLSGNGGGAGGKRRNSFREDGHRGLAIPSVMELKRVEKNDCYSSLEQNDKIDRNDDSNGGNCHGNDWKEDSNRPTDMQKAKEEVHFEHDVGKQEQENSVSISSCSNYPEQQDAKDEMIV